MQIELISDENLSVYMKLMSNDEIFGSKLGSCTCFGAFDEEKNEAMGLVTARILPRHIVINRLYTAPEHRNRGCASALLALITDVPEDIRMTFYMIIDSEDADTAFLARRGFVRANSKYRYICGTVGDMSDLKVPENLREGLEIVTLDHVSDKALDEYIFSGHYDSFLRFPEMELDRDRYSEASLVCLNGGKIEAVMLLEELDDFIEIGCLKSNDARSAYYVFSRMKEILLDEYGENAAVRFLKCSDEEESQLARYFKQSTEMPVRLFKMKRG